LHDVVVPRTRLAESLAGFYDIGRRHELAVTCIAHAGDGNLHPHLHFVAREPGVLERVLAASAEVVRLAVDLGGTLSGEHGIGLEKRDFLPLVLSEDDLAAQACVRAAFDPERRMNPDKVLPDGARCAEVPAAGVVAAGASAEGAEGGWS
ncbi:MAG TPA: FAD-linked oxidase C-terminal domain-containing protein, partial [Actinomycetota bacterium]|nr:FAD-linked oxidase C-terminal domain-containing protein [Actinomycetota bacterium]